MLPYHVETAASALRAMLHTLVIVTTRLSMASTATKVSSYMFFWTSLDFWQSLHRNWHHLHWYKTNLDFWLHNDLFKDIGAYFELGSWLRYNIRKKPISDEAAWANWIDPHYDNFSLGYNDTSDDIEFSFSTVYKPAVLLYISSFVQDYIAVILMTDGKGKLRNLSANVKAWIFKMNYRLAPQSGKWNAVIYENNICCSSD